MKKTTFTLFTLLITAVFFGQTYSTGIKQLSSSGLDYKAQVDVTSSLVTVTMIGPSDRWMALGFSNASVVNMASGTDVIAFDGTNLTDRTLGGIGVYDLDSGTGQSWTITSNTINAGVRTLVGTRVLNTGEANDYVFSAAAGSLNLCFSRAATATFTLQPHGGLSNAGNVASNLTLGNDSFKIDDFKIYPNPAKGFTTIELPTNVDSGTVKIYDSLGRVVKNQTVSTSQNEINTSELTTGTYMVVLRTEYGNATKTLLVN